MTEFGALLFAYRKRIPRDAVRGGNRFAPKRPYMSQNQLAQRSGVDVAYVNRLERGHVRAPSREIVVALAAGLGLGAAERSALLRSAGYTPTLRRTA